MPVKDILKETQKNVDIGVIEQFFFDSMSNFYGKGDLSWIGCLFGELRDVLKVEKGMVHCHIYGINKVEEHLTQSRIYGEYGRPQALFYTKELPKGFNLFMTGPEHNDKNLRILCSSSEPNIRDFEEQVVIEKINSNIEELIKGKHENVEGVIKLYESSSGGLRGVALHKTWKMPIEPSFLFRKDIEDIQTFSQIYNSFFNYQLKRDESFENTATRIIEEVLDKKRD